LSASAFCRRTLARSVIGPKATSERPAFPQPSVVAEIPESFQVFPSARQLVRDKRRNTRDGLSVFGMIPFWGSHFLDTTDKKARTMNPHSSSMETQRAHHRRTSDYHHLPPRQRD
jgi:hypothetical protein